MREPDGPQVLDELLKDPDFDTGIKNVVVLARLSANQKNADMVK